MPTCLRATCCHGRLRDHKLISLTDGPRITVGPRGLGRKAVAGTGRAAAVQEAPVEAAAPGAAVVPATFVTPDEAAVLSTGQVAFLERKRRAAAGLGPVMPPSSACPRCEGIGTCACSQCGGEGVNASNVGEELFQNEHQAVFQRNGLVDVRWFMLEGAPCWLCRGKCHMGCPDCGGSGVAGGVDRYTGD